MKEDKINFLNTLKRSINNLNKFIKGDAEDKTRYYKCPNGKNENIKIGIDRGHPDIADRIFSEQRYYDILNKIQRKIGKEIPKHEFLLYAGYILVDEGNSKDLMIPKEQREQKMLIYCTYSLSKDNLDFIDSKKREWKYYDPIIKDMYDSDIDESEKEKIRKIVDFIKSEIEKARINNESQCDQEIQGG